MPSKFYSIAAAGRPTIFIGSKNGEIARILEENGCGFTVTPGDGEALTEQAPERSQAPRRGWWCRADALPDGEEARRDGVRDGFHRGETSSRARGGSG